MARILAGLGRRTEATARARAAATDFRAAGAEDDARYADELATQLAADEQEQNP